MSTNNSYDPNFAPKPIAGLLDGKHRFVIPSFQRGYRWEEKQVLDLLEDIKQFANDKSKGDSYYLQPVVVKACEDGAFEVLDGQQRLTTMLLLLKRLMKRLSEDEREGFEENLYKITYTNRPQLDFDNPNPNDNIDSYYLAEAKQVIDDWFNTQKQNKQNLDAFKGSLLYNQERQVKIIWYAIDESSEDLVSINIFNRLNKGKIPLTSSELIKALFIMDYDLRAEGDKLPAEQLSMEWNEMERKFQDDNFWYFISDDSKGVQSRIDVLFDFVTCRKESDEIDYSYREFQKLYDFCREQERNKTNETFNSDWIENVHSMQEVWKKVRKTFDRLVAWYEDNLYYHYVGYLVAVGFTPLQIYNHLENKKRESKEENPNHEWTIDDTMLELRKKMMEKFKRDNKFLDKDSIDDFEYGNEYILRILLLFNVESCRKANNIRFAFNKYKTGSWDIEHIDSRNDSSLQKFEDRMRWLRQVGDVLGMEHTQIAKELQDKCLRLIEEFDSNEQVNQKSYTEFYQDVNKFYSAESGEDYKSINLSTKSKDSISNLTLLDSATNREYKDAPFAFKRCTIIKHDKKGERFIPLCTRNVFLKYYTDSDNNSSYLDNMRWNSADKSGYMKAIHEIVDPIFDSVIVKEKEVENE